MFSSVRRRLKRPGSPTQSPEVTDSDPYHKTSTSGDVDGIWQNALDDYRRSLPPDLCDFSIRFVNDTERCRTSEDILNLLQGTSVRLGKRREGNDLANRLRSALKPLVYGLGVILDATAETASALNAPAGKGIFAAVAVLLKAADRVSDIFDDLERLLKRMSEFVERLRVRVRELLMDGSRRIVVKALVEILKAFELAMRMLKRGRIQHFVHALFSKGDDIKSALQALADVTSEEERMAIAELVVGLGQLHAKVDDMNASVSTVQSEKIYGMMQENTASNSNILTALEGLREANATQSSRTEIALGTQTTIAGQQEVVRPRSPRDYHALGRMLRYAVSRFSSEDQDVLWRAFATMFTWAVDAAGESSQAMITLTRVAQVAESMIAMTVTFLFLFMIWRLGSVSRPLGLSPGSIIIVDVLGEVLFSSPRPSQRGRTRTRSFCRPSAAALVPHMYKGVSTAWATQNIS
ncbi:hypothetical protein PENSPDRAFT_230549 [Peniophora sp. CONT]|nr:hypothetical protein PENSPDRAFT_230549 [Peniophora sp. CONT]